MTVKIQYYITATLKICNILSCKLKYGTFQKRKLLAKTLLQNK